jgi:hypothetical protein
MTIDFVRPMGVPPVREPKPVPPSSNHETVETKRSDDSQRPVAPDPVRGHAIDVKA